MNEMNETQLHLATLTAIARQLSDLQQRILQALKDKGPGLLLEVAVRVLKFQEDVQAPVRELQALGLVETQKVSGGPFGGDLFSLTRLGDRVLRLSNDLLFSREVSADSKLKRQEAELLNKLGDVAREKGDLDQAVDYYQQALSSYRTLLSV